MPNRTKAKPASRSVKSSAPKKAKAKRPVAKPKPKSRAHVQTHTPHPVPAPAPVSAPVSVSTPEVQFSKALKFLSSLIDHERLRIVRYTPENFNLDRMRNLLKKMGNPHDQFKSIHVAGTKGKGSTCTMIANILQAAGYKVGLYLSPHLLDITERIAINGALISHADFAKIIRNIEPIVKKLKPVPTFFDVITAAAFKYFADAKVDIAIIETGLGGRLDSTNVLKPEVAAITSISKDHMAQLGHTLPRIAEEKAGIIKQGVPVVTVLQDPAVEHVLANAAARVGTTLDITGKTIEFSYRFESSRMLGPHNRICLSTPTSKFEHLPVPLVGEHQAINCGLALAVIDKLKTRGFNVPDAKAMEGLGKTFIPGRMEIIAVNPRILVDGAHNAASIDAMMRAIGQHIPYDSMVVIFGCCADKDIPGMLERITSGADKVIFTRVNSIRSANPEDLAQQYVELYGKMAQVAPNLQAAMEIAKRAVTKEDLICITGSFYLVGEAKQIFGQPIPNQLAAAAMPPK